MQLARTCTRPGLAAALAVLVAAGTASAIDEVPEYHVTRLGPLLDVLFPGVQFPQSRGRGLNENGDLVGDAATGGNQIQGWIYTVEHGVVALPLLPGFTSNVPLDVSDRDATGEVIIVGGAVPSIYWDLTLGTAALWRFSTVTGEVLETREIGILPGFDESIAVAVNNGGAVVGFCNLTGPFSPFKYDIATEVLEPLDFPVRPAAINNVGQVIGGRYRGDLDGNFVDLGIPPDCTSSTLGGINDLGWVTGRAGRPFTDGAGHFMVSVTRFTDAGWHVMPAFSHLDNGNDINIHGDVSGDIGVSGAVRSMVYIAALDTLHLLEDLVSPEFLNEVFPTFAADLNDAGQIGAYSGDAILLTPLGRMIIPGDVNGDVQVNLDDYCAWLANPIDLDGDGDVDEADEQWLIDRLAVFGFTLADCNANGVADHCDILSGLSADCDGNDVPDECQGDCNADGVPDVCEPDCNANGNPDPCDIAQGLSEDCNLNGIPDECDGGGLTQAMNFFDPSVDLIEGMTFSDDLLVIDSGVIEDVDFTIDIDYRIGYLTVLLSHNGTTITLLERPGHPETSLGNGQLGYDIILDDEGTGGPIEDEGNFGSPFEPIVSPPSYAPDDLLSAFDGMPSEGIWTVTVITHDPGSSPVDQFNDWGLFIIRAAEPVGICDCNGNGVPDDQDIADGTSLDADGNGIPDECEAAPGDLDGNGVVDIADLLDLLAAWGACPAPCPPACSADLDEDCAVGITDVLVLLGNWG
jgi:hypothetical protein